MAGWMISKYDQRYANLTEVTALDKEKKEKKKKKKKYHSRVRGNGKREFKKWI